MNPARAFGPAVVTGYLQISTLSIHAVTTPKCRPIIITTIIVIIIRRALRERKPPSTVSLFVVFARYLVSRMFVYLAMVTNSSMLS